jgi:hypothetical protein
MTNPWTVIEPPSQDLNARRIDHTHPYDMFWAKDHVGHYLFVYEFPKDRSDVHQLAVPDLAGIKVQYVLATTGSAKNQFALILNDPQDWELFYSLCADLVGTTRQAATPQSALQAILRRLARWHEFLKAGRNGLLSEEKIKGLIGELLFLKKHLIPAFGLGHAVEFWQGPEGAPQDFAVANCAIEVKCQSGGTRPYVRISSEFQLCSQLPELYLFVVTLGKGTEDLPGTVTLPGLIADIRTALASAAYDPFERFNDLLYSVGYIDLDAYLDFIYVVTDESMYRVGPDFPRVCHDTLPQGIAHVTYDLDLVVCAQYAARPSWMEALW